MADAAQQTGAARAVAKACALVMIEKPTEAWFGEMAALIDGYADGKLAAERRRQEAETEKHVQKARVEIGRRVLAESKLAQAEAEAAQAFRLAEERLLAFNQQHRRASDSEAARAGLVGLVEAFIDPDPCEYDHHGLCQAHSLHERPCPHEEAKALLARLAATAGTPE